MLLAPDGWADRKLRVIKTFRGRDHKPYQFETSCIACTGEDIDNMRSSARTITYQTMRKMCDLSGFQIAMGYDSTGQNGRLTLNKDWHVEYCAGTFRGQRCYFLVHSGIEYIWVRRNS